MTDAPHSPSRRERLARLAAAIAPWIAFLCFMGWAWGPRDLFRTVPHYGDALETIASATWFKDALAQGRNPLIYPYNYFPEGWRVGSHSVGALLYLVLAPLVRIGGGAFAYNFAMLFACVFGFGGALLLARRHLPLLSGTVAALAITFWSMRWGAAMEGRLNVLLAATMLPWMLWGSERALAASSRRRRGGWLLLVAVFWAVALNLSLYFAYVGGVLLAIWMLLSTRGGGGRHGPSGCWPWASPVQRCCCSARPGWFLTCARRPLPIRRSTASVR